MRHPRRLERRAEARARQRSHESSCRSRKSADKERPYRDRGRPRPAFHVRRRAGAPNSSPPRPAEPAWDKVRMTSPQARVSIPILLLVLAAAGLAACETAGLGPTTEAAKPVEPPMTHRRAAEQCWMATEKGSDAMQL